MQTVILAGGKGTRIQSVSKTIPKSLLPVAGKPFVDHQLDLLQTNGIEHVLFCTGHLGEQLLEHVGDGSSRSMKIHFSQEDPESLLGTGGALINALPLLEDEFMVLYGDSYLPTDYRRVQQEFDGRGLNAMMCVFKNDGKWDSSNVRVENDMVAFYEKGADQSVVDHIDYGLSVFTKSVIERYKDEEMPLDLARIQGDLVKSGELGAHVVSERFYEIGKPEGLQELDEYLKRNGGMVE